MIKKIMRPGRIIAMGFAILIIVGSLLLFLPISHQTGANMTYLDSLFTATSAVCITGLSVITCADSLSNFGQAVLLILIQLGGMGITTLGASIILLTNKKLGFQSTTLVKESLGQEGYKGIVQVLKTLLIVTFGIEFLGAIFAFPVFYQSYSIGKSIWLSVFHSISAFNNAGFDIIGSDSLSTYKDNNYMLIITSILTIIGGLGFFVISDIVKNHKVWKWSLHTKIVLLMTGLLLILGTLFLYFTEEKLNFIQAFFYSAVTRTSGFTIYHLSDFSHASLLVMCILMFIGAAPGSTGGGIKITTIFICNWAVLFYAKNKQPTIFKRRISSESRDKALILLILGVVVVLIASFLLCVFEPTVDPLHILLESVSAFATVGLSADLTSTLQKGSQIVLILVMYIGRLGPLSIATLFIKENKQDTILRPEEYIPVG